LVLELIKEGRRRLSTMLMTRIPIPNRIRPLPTPLGGTKGERLGPDEGCSTDGDKGEEGHCCSQKMGEEIPRIQKETPPKNPESIAIRNPP